MLSDVNLSSESCVSHVDRWQQRPWGPLEGLLEREDIEGVLCLEKGIRLQLFVPVSPGLGALDA